MDRKPVPDVVGMPMPPPIAVNADGQIIFDEMSLALLDAHIRKIVQEELEKLMSHIAEQVGARLVRQIRMQGVRSHE